MEKLQYLFPHMLQCRSAMKCAYALRTSYQTFDDPLPFAKRLAYSTRQHWTFFTPHICARWLSLSFILLVTKQNLRWHKLASSRISEHIRSMEDTPILLVSASGLNHFHSWRFHLFPYYPVHFGSHFIYGHVSCLQLICHVFTYIHAHANN